MYTLILNTGEVIRNSDNKVVAPCDSIMDVDYQEFVTWSQNNQLTETSQPSPEYEYINKEWVVKFSFLKEQKLKELNEKFAYQFSNGVLHSSLGFSVDNRRFGDKNDKDNIEGLIQLGILFYKDVDNVLHNLTMEQMVTLKMEMIGQGLGLYNTKWYFEDLINKAITNTELDAINIAF